MGTPHKAESILLREVQDESGCREADFYRRIARGVVHSVEEVLVHIMGQQEQHPRCLSRYGT